MRRRGLFLVIAVVAGLAATSAIAMAGSGGGTKNGTCVRNPDRQRCKQSADPGPTVSPISTVSPSPTPTPAAKESPTGSPAPKESPTQSATPSISGSASSDPPPATGYFSLEPAAAWDSLPSGSDCAAQVHRSTWEIRPENETENHTVPGVRAVHEAFAARPRGSEYDPRWDAWLLQRVDGQFTGTTDEIFQWAACKWGLPDNLLRGMAVRESTWYEVLHFGDGSCYWDRGCGDAFSSASAASKVYCDGLAAYDHDYQTDVGSSIGNYPHYGAGFCPKTFSIFGVMAWADPGWVAPAPAYPGNQNGTFPFSRDSTAFAADYVGSYLRGCYNGWIHWLHPNSGDLWGCVGSWYAGDWHSSAADGYASRVQNEISNATWLTPTFADGRGNQYQCDPIKGCPA